MIVALSRYLEDPWHINQEDKGMISLDVLVAVVLGVAAIAASHRYYVKSSKDLERVRSGLESQNISIFRIINAQNPNQQDEPFKGSDGKWNVKWVRTIDEPPVLFTDEIGAEVIHKAASKPATVI
jgi:hypothetical protein